MENKEINKQDMNSFVKEAASFISKKHGKEIFNRIETLTEKYHSLTEEKFHEEEFYEFVETVIEDLTELNEHIAEKFDI